MAILFGTGSTTGANTKLTTSADASRPYRLWVVSTAGGTLLPTGGTSITLAANVIYDLGALDTLGQVQYNIASGSISWWADPI